MSFFKNLFSGQNENTVTPEEASRRVAAGTAVLIDVREADEWADTGVAGPALTLAMSALRSRSPAWTKALEANKDRDILLYCHSGARSDRVAELLRGQGYRAFNVGGVSGWARAGLPMRKP